MIRVYPLPLVGGKKCHINEVAPNGHLHESLSVRRQKDTRDRSHIEKNVPS